MEKIISNYVFDYMTIDHKLFECPLTDFKEYALHMHDCYELLYFLHGDAAFIIDGQYFKLQEHDVLLVKRKAVHHIKILSNMPYERYDVLFNLDECPSSIFDFFYKTELINCRDNDAVLQTLRQFEYFSKLPFGEFESVAKGLLKQLLFSLFLGGTGKDEKDLTNTAISDIILKALDYINENLFTIESISEICKKLFVSEGYFFTSFKKQINITPKRYILQKRLVAAWDRIKAGEKPTDVAYHCGFNNYVNFYRDFVAFFGVKPSECFNSKTTRIFMKNNNV